MSERGPLMRAGDQDRNEAILALSDHFAEGRLDQAEFDARMTAASEATYLHDLDPLFADLPGRSLSTSRVELVADDRGPRGAVRRHMRRPPFPVVPLVFAGIVALVMAFGFHVLLVVLPALWIVGGVARRRAWHRHAMAVGHAPRPPSPTWR